MEQGHASASDPDMDQFVYQREDLRGQVVRAVDEDEWRVVIDQCKSLELFRVKRSMWVVPNNSIEYNEDTELIDSIPKGG